MINNAIYEAKDGKGLKLLTPKQMLQRLPIKYSLYQAKEITKKIYNNKINSIKL